MKIRFYPYHSTLQRVKDELKFRDTCTISEDEDGILVSDCVDGLQELAVWLRGFGPGAEVLCPEALRKLVQNEWEEMAQHYQVRGGQSEIR